MDKVKLYGMLMVIEQLAEGQLKLTLEGSHQRTMSSFAFFSLFVARALFF